MSIKVSIIIPVYNVEQYIEQCLESVYTQNVPIDTYEVIVVNDGTKDNSMNIVDKYATKYSNLTVINQENKGLSEARNTGLKAAKGEYIWFIDSDDWINKDILKNIFLLIDKHNADVYATPLNKIKENSKVGIYDININDDIVLSGKDYLFRGFFYGASPRFILKRSFLLANNLQFQPNLLHEDGEFGPRMLYLAENVYVICYSIYNYRLRTSNSIMSSWKRKGSDDLIYIHKKLKSFCDISVSNPTDKKKFNLIIFSILKASIIFAKVGWESTEFKEFCKENINYIKEESKSNVSYFTLTHFGLKTFLSFIIISIQPIAFLKCRN